MREGTGTLIIQQLHRPPKNLYIQIGETRSVFSLLDYGATPLFVDSLKFGNTGKSQEQMPSDMNNDLNLIRQWMDRHKMTLKTYACYSEIKYQHNITYRTTTLTLKPFMSFNTDRRLIANLFKPHSQLNLTLLQHHPKQQKFRFCKTEQYELCSVVLKEQVTIKYFLPVRYRIRMNLVIQIHTIK